MAHPNLILAAAFAALLLAAPVAEAARFADPASGIEVRIRDGRATVRYPDPQCGIWTSRPTPVRRGRFSRKERAWCYWESKSRESTLVLTGKLAGSRVRGRIGPTRFVARRNAPRPTRAQRCSWRGMPIAANDFLRVFVERDRTIACRRSDGSGVEIARTVWDEHRYYSTGVAARLVQIAGTRIAYVSTPFDSARSKYEGDPGHQDQVVVRNLADGAVTRGQAADVHSVAALAMLDDGTAAWTGRHQSYSQDDVLVQRLHLGKVETLDRGPIDELSLRVVDGAFVWNRR